jgi:RNA polymerase sigma-70 factor (ECF subfamily)
MSVVAMGIRLDRAEEVAQRAWARILEKHERGEIDTLILPGIVVAQARFLALDEMRRSSADRNNLDAAEVTLRDLAPSPEQRLLAKEELARAFAAVAACTPAAQRVFRAVYDAPQRPHEEIARELGISVQRVRQTLCEVRRKVRDALAEVEP